MRIGDLAQRTGVSPRSLRYYEQQGLLASQRTGGGQRVYRESAVARVRRIQQLYSAGMSSSAIYRILPCIRDDDGGPAESADEQLAADLQQERDRLESRIGDLQASLRSLDQVIADAALDQAPEVSSGDTGESGTSS